jgi:hypothetical protein
LTLLSSTTQYPAQRNAGVGGTFNPESEMTNDPSAGKAIPAKRNGL